MIARNLRQTRADESKRSRQKAPDDWVTGNRPMTAAQASYLKRLCEHAGEAFEAKLTKAQAAKRIDALRAHSVLVRHAR